MEKKLEALLSKVPGYRSGKPRRMIIATVYYVMAISKIHDGFYLFLGLMSMPFLFFSALNLTLYKARGDSFKNAIIPFVISALFFSFAIFLTPGIRQ